MCIINLYVILSVIVVYMINCVNHPIEISIQKKFYNKAKKKLNERPNLQVIGITGSYGKTSCKHILTTILEQKYNVLKQMQKASAFCLLINPFMIY